MNILFFTNSLAGGGAERVVATLANFWVQQDWDVTVVTLAPDSEDFYPLDARVTRVSLHLSSQSGSVYVAIRQNIRRILALRRVIHEVRPTVAVAMMSTPNVLLALSSYGMSNLCTIGSERCFPPHSPLGRIWGALVSRMYGRLSAVVALTREAAEWITVHSSARHVAVIPNAATWPLPANPPEILPRAFSASGRKLLLAVGRLDFVKNCSTLLYVFAQLAEKYPDWDLAILGEGPERLALEAIVRDKKLMARVFMPGIVGNVGHWYAHADLYAMTSHSEGFPNALVEALAHGLPAVSVDCDTGPRDIIRHGIDGLLVPQGNLALLVDALDRVMGDAVLRRRLAVRAPDARERFSVERIAGMWEQLFHALADTGAFPNVRNKSRVFQWYVR